MSTTTTTERFQADTQIGLPDIIYTLIASIRAGRAIRRERAQMYTELMQCSDRELADMNVSRADIDYIVRNWHPASV